MIFGRNRAGGEAPGGASDDAAGRGHRHGHAHGHPHAHAPAGDRFDARLLATTALNAVVTVAEIVGGIAAGSLALLADALHNLSDVAALALALVARRLGRRPPTARFTYGFKRVEAMAALINGLALLVVSGFIAVEALKRLQAPEPPHATAMFVVALVALAGNGFSVLLLRGHDHADLNLRAAVLHLVQDASASLAVVLAALFSGTRFGPYLDPLASLLVCGLVLRGSFSLVVEVFHVLVEATPRGLDLEELAARIDAEFAPARLDHVHAWEVGPGQRVLTAHLLVPPMTVAEAEALCARVRARLADGWGIDHATLETAVFGQDDGGCLS